MKYIFSGILIVGLILALFFWIKNNPSENVGNLSPAISNEKKDEISTVKTSEEQTLSNNKIIIKNGMKIEIVKEGTGEEIINGKTAVVDYVGKLEDGSVFDASKKHGDSGFSFSLGAGQVIKGWDEGVLGMKVGEVRMLTIPPEMGYGPNGYPPVIPANATLIFEVTLLSIR